MNARWMTACAMAVAILVLPGRAGLAQGRNDRNRGQNDQDQNRWDRGGFNDHDRDATRGWYNEHRRRPPVGLRRIDRLPPYLEARLRIGGVLVPMLRSRIHAVPADLLYRLPRAPRGYRYVIIGGHVCLIDTGYRVRDMIWLELW